jgi:hemin uptake protein HemP
MQPDETEKTPLPAAIPGQVTNVGSNAVRHGPRELTSDELLCGQHEVCIRHGEEIYRLRVTRNGKLILHK